MKDQLLKLIPEFNEIRNEDLRNKTIAAFALAIEKGGWTPDDLAKIPFTLLIKDTNVSFLEHTRAVTNVCMGMARALTPIYGPRMPIDWDVLVSGAILHDVGKLLEYKKEGGAYMKSANGKLLRHPFSGVGMCWKHGLPDEVMHIVATHSKEGDHVQRTLESIIFHHADFVDFDIACALGKAAAAKKKL